mmetsp:Transcript_26662/g.87417  ORF Transcript_26662/g.87417 Transcript_26662/m.87417 type:complete len:257 (-) Transcript_26662:121-891(-)
MEERWTRLCCGSCAKGRSWTTTKRRISRAPWVRWRDRTPFTTRALGLRRGRPTLRASRTCVRSGAAPARLDLGLRTCVGRGGSRGASSGAAERSRARSRRRRRSSAERTGVDAAGAEGAEGSGAEATEERWWRRQRWRRNGCRRLFCPRLRRHRFPRARSIRSRPRRSRLRPCPHLRSRHPLFKIPLCTIFILLPFNCSGMYVTHPSLSITHVRARHLPKSKKMVTAMMKQLAPTQGLRRSPIRAAFHGSPRRPVR